MLGNNKRVKKGKNYKMQKICFSTLMQITGGGGKRRRCEEDDGGSNERGKSGPIVVYPQIYRSML